MRAGGGAPRALPEVPVVDAVQVVDPTRAVTLPDIGVPLYFGVFRRITYPYNTWEVGRESRRGTSFPSGSIAVMRALVGTRSSRQ